MSMIALTLTVGIMAAILVPLLIRDAARAEERARWRRLTRPLRLSFEGFAASLGAALMPAMQRAVAAAADMEATMRKVDDAITGAGARLADEAERYANEVDQP